MAEHDEHGLEDAFRAGLQRHAEPVDVSAPVAQRAVAANRRRRQGLVLMAAAAAVVVIGVTGALATRDAVTDGDSRIGDRSSRPGAVVTEWRTEYWHGMQVDVPADWGWGTAPVSSGELKYLCGGAGAMVMADGRRAINADPTEPWVGRPIRISDACAGGDPIEIPAAPYVWLGADLELGTVELAGGYTQQTVEVDGSTLTVGTDDDRVREQIIDSARPGDQCPREAPKRPAVPSMLTEGMGDLTSAEVCAYVLVDERLELVYATTLGESGARAYQRAYGAAPRANDETADCVKSDEYVVVTLTGDDPYGPDPVSQGTVVDLDCARIEVTPGEFVRLTSDAEASLFSNGLQVVLPSLIGPFG